MDANTQALDKALVNQLALLRKSTAKREQIVVFLQSLERDIIKAIDKSELGTPSRSGTQRTRLLALQKEVRQLIDLNLGEARDAFFELVRDVAQEEAVKATSVLSATLGVELQVPTLTTDYLETIVDETLIEGAPSSDWWARQIPQIRQRFADQMRLGIARGETVDQLIDRVRGKDAQGEEQAIPGLMNIARRNVEALVRSSLISVANKTHLEVYGRFANITKGIMWVSTLDTRTSDICKALDGKTWDNDLNPIGHKMAFPGPTAHWNCRSTQVPVLKSWEELAREAGGDTELAKTLDKVPEGTRASMNGQVPQTEKYGPWLKRQPDEVQRQALGARKYRLFKEGTVKTMEELLFM